MLMHTLHWHGNFHNLQPSAHCLETAILYSYFNSVIHIPNDMECSDGKFRSFPWTGRSFGRSLKWPVHIVHSRSFSAVLRVVLYRSCRSFSFIQRTSSVLNQSFRGSLLAEPDRPSFQAMGYVFGRIGCNSLTSSSRQPSCFCPHWASISTVS